MLRQSLRGMPFRGRLATFVAAIALLASAQGMARAEEAEPVSPSPAPGTPLRRQASYSGLFPLYSHERFEDGSARTRGAVGLVHIDREPDGSFRHGVLPLYDASGSSLRGEHGLAIYPLLFFHGRSPGKGFDIIGPFARWYRGESHHLLLWPLLH